ncbi:MAG: sugar transferase [Clostridium sp.]|nr:sugar transferase [Clostridium sp.]
MINTLSRESDRGRLFYLPGAAPDKGEKEGRASRKYEGVDIAEVYRQKSGAYKSAKRAFDIAASALALVVLSPVFLITAAAIKLEDGGPVFFAGRRYGRDLQYFHMLKFRSMCVDAEERLKDVLKEGDKNGMAFKINDDPRITKVGKFIRRTSIDELPQLWNVLKGEMSLVGPRPISTTDKEEDAYDMQRWAVRPGLTCTWQVCGRADVPWEDWVEMDLDYIVNMSMAEDMKLIFKTFGAVVKGNGAR